MSTTLTTTVTNEQVRAVLTALGEDKLLDFPIAWDKNNVGYLEYTELSARLVLADDGFVQSVADYINGE